MSSDDAAGPAGQIRKIAPNARAAGDEATSQFALLGNRKFMPLFVVQALGAFNDNVFKMAFVSLMTYVLAGQMEMGIEVLAPIASGVFIIPFAFLAPFAGQIADRVDKAKMMRWTKFSELVLMVAAAIAFLTQHIGFLFLLLFLMGAQSAFFAPIKYGLLPQYLTRRQLVPGNGLIQAATFVAILGGSIAGANLVLTPQGAEIVSGVVISIALIGWIASLYAVKAPPASGVAPVGPRSLIDGSLNLRRIAGGFLDAKLIAVRFAAFFCAFLVLWALIEFVVTKGPLSSLENDKPWLVLGAAIFVFALYVLWPSLLDSLSSARQSRPAFNAIRAIAWFWFVGATYLAILPVLASVELKGDETVYTLLLSAFTIGIGLGSLITGAFFGGGGVRVGAAPWGAVGMAVFSIDLAFAIDSAPEIAPAYAQLVADGITRAAGVLTAPAAAATALTESVGPLQSLMMSAAPCERIFVDGVLTARIEGTCVNAVEFVQTGQGLRVLIDFTLASICAGVYLTPLNALYQAESPAGARGRIVACSNMVDSTFMAVSSIAIVVLGAMHLPSHHILAIIGATGFLAAFIVARWAPDTALGRVVLKAAPLRRGD